MPKAADQTTTIKELKELIVKFRDERGWRQHHNPKSLAMSIAIEAAELMEHFQWDHQPKSEKQDIADELGDILIYCFNFADIMDIDISTAFRDKMDKNFKKYPPKLFGPDGNLDKYHKVKRQHRAPKG